MTENVELMDFSRTRSTSTTVEKLVYRTLHALGLLFPMNSIVKFPTDASFTEAFRRLSNILNGIHFQNLKKFYLLSQVDTKIRIVGDEKVLKLIYNEIKLMRRETNEY